MRKKSYQEFVSRIFTEGKDFIDYDSAKKVLPYERQCENGFYQRTNGVSVAFANSTLVQKSTDVESVEKIIDFTVNLNVGLRF